MVSEWSSGISGGIPVTLYRLGSLTFPRDWKLRKLQTLNIRAGCVAKEDSHGIHTGSVPGPNQRVFPCY